MKTNIKGAFMSDCCNRIQPVLLSVLRIVTAYLFLLHGTSKIFAFPIEMGSGSPGGLLLLAGILEIVGGILLVLGLFARPAAFVLSGQMAVAYFMAHAFRKCFVPDCQRRRVRSAVLLRISLYRGSGRRSMVAGQAVFQA